MIKYENLCVDCTALGLHCLGVGCPNHKPVEVHVCDQCENVLDDIYEVEGAELCEDCLKEMFRKDC